MITVRTAFTLAAPLALALAATPMIAQAPALPGQPDKARVTAGSYAADPNHSLVAWSVNHLGFNDYFGLFGSVTGTLTLDPANPSAAKVTATIPVSKVITASAGLTAHLLRPGADGKKPDFFGPAPADATFTSTSVTPGADGTSATVAGNLTLNGVTKPVSIAAHFIGAGKNIMSGKETVGFEGATTIKRSDFGVNGVLPFVSDEVKLNITIAFEKTA
ncbi:MULTISPECIES: YceI family protein [unclassified Novosphingobium]|uniref:YceI family protein n=1 Tax=unclassified Novosphingobium TaxID=2644732 RepID=UPI001444B201|nr:MULTISPECIES: YceI family protein [unclassified Novosphingobium]NKJ41479.1 polyisoprenoid-binding protein YceI [Novosphingobium sp. SG720]NMN03731.1 polyisoprenoid-binding protein YceI [Novosphingobium sp. SG919]NMN86279.1 polyisoprenoid-binding protein YceI [Novosphingobium sp. SG916]